MSNRLEGTGKALVQRLALLSLIVLMAGLVPSTGEARYSDGRRAYDAGNVTKAVSLWRRSAWQDDDLLSQIELGNLYATGKDSPRDDIEAYVWYYLASINTRAIGISPEARSETERLRTGALIERAKLFGPMVPSLRSEAHNRIIYIMASRGAEGFFRLAELYDERFGEFSAAPQVQSPSGTGAGSDLLPGLFPQGTSPTVGGADSGAGTTDTGSSGSILSESDRERYALFSGISRNNAEAIAYYTKAGERGHPLGRAMGNSLREAMSNLGNDYGRLVLEAAARRAASWSPPFEIYPGAHSDESVGDADREDALIATERLEVRFVQHALRALGLYRGAIDNAAGPLTRAGIRQFQNQLGERETGELTPAQTVHLIKSAALRSHAVSQNALATMYFKGIGEPVDYIRARYWFQKAADQRYPFALYNLGVIYRDGLGVPADRAVAASYFLAARAAGYGSVDRELRQVGWE